MRLILAILVYPIVILYRVIVMLMLILRYALRIVEYPLTALKFTTGQWHLTYTRYN